MQAYCSRRAREGIDEISAFRHRYGISNLSQEERDARIEAGDDVAINISGGCLVDYQGDYAMIAYCHCRQTEAAQQLGIMPEPVN